MNTIHSLRRVLLLALLATCAGMLHAQLGLRLVQMRPTGKLGFVMEKKISGELMFIDDFEDDWRVRFSLGFFHLEPRMKVFPITGFISDSDGSRYVAGTESYSKWNMTWITGGMDRSIVRFRDETLVIYAGADGMFGGVNTAYERSTPGISSESFSGGYVYVGVRGRIGVDQSFGDQFGVFLETSRAYYVMQEIGGLNHNDIGFGVRYTFY